MASLRNASVWLPKLKIQNAPSFSGPGQALDLFARDCFLNFGPGPQNNNKMGTVDYDKEKVELDKIKELFELLKASFNSLYEFKLSFLSL